MGTRALGGESQAPASSSHFKFPQRTATMGGTWFFCQFFCGDGGLTVNRPFMRLVENHDFMQTHFRAGGAFYDGVLGRFAVQMARQYDLNQKKSFNRLSSVLLSHTRKLYWRHFMGVRNVTAPDWLSVHIRKAPISVVNRWIPLWRVWNWSATATVHVA